MPDSNPGPLPQKSGALAMSLGLMTKGKWPHRLLCSIYRTVHVSVYFANMQQPRLLSNIVHMHVPRSCSVGKWQHSPLAPLLPFNPILLINLCVSDLSPVRPVPGILNSRIGQPCPPPCSVIFTPTNVTKPTVLHASQCCCHHIFFYYILFSELRQ